MVKLSAPLAILALCVAGALAQDQSAPQKGGDSNSPSPSQQPQSSAAPSSASPKESPSQQDKSQPTSPPKGGDKGAEGAKGDDDVCVLLQGNPKVHRVAGCGDAKSTTVPPYNLSSLVSYFIGGYEPEKEGKMVSEVASDLAGSVTHYYPTVTASFDDIRYAMYTGIMSSIKAQGYNDFAPVDKLKGPNGEDAAASLKTYPAVFAAVAAVAAGAIFL